MPAIGFWVIGARSGTDFEQEIDVIANNAIETRDKILISCVLYLKLSIIINIANLRLCQT